MVRILRRATFLAVGPGLTAIVVFGAQPRPSTTVTFGPHEEGPPPGHTGGFDEPTCRACHAEFELNPPSGALGIDGFPNSYNPEQRYRIVISVLGDDMVAAGFQAAVRFARGPNEGRSAGQFEPLDTHVDVRRAPDTGVDYVQHTRDGSRAVQNGVATWTFVWTAPADTARVVLNVAANDANGDNSPLGDFVYTQDLVSDPAASDNRGLDQHHSAIAWRTTILSDQAAQPALMP